MVSDGDLCMLNAGAGGGSQSCESSFGEMKAASGRVKLRFRTVLWVFCARGDGCSGKPTGRSCAMGIAACVSLSQTLSLTPFNVNQEIVPSSFCSDMLPTRWLRLAPSPCWNWTSCVK